MIKDRLESWFPHPVLSVVLLICWLLLNNSFSAGHIVLGSVLSIIIPWFTSSFWPEKINIKNIKTFALFVVIVAYDIIVANLIVAKLILGSNDKLKPHFLEIQLDAKNDLTITLLASTISLTPGTVSSDLSMDKKTLLVHALHVEDIDKEIKTIKTRYEKPLMEVFES